MEDRIKEIEIQSALQKHKELIVEKLSGEFIDELYIQNVISGKDMDRLTKLDSRAAVQKLIQCLDEKSILQLTRFLGILKKYHSDLHGELECSIRSGEICVWKVVKNVLRNLHAVLLKHLKVKDIAPEMYAKNALTWDEYSSLDRDTGHEQTQANKEFFHYVRDKPDEAKVLGVFLQCLQIKQPDLYAMIHGEMDKFGVVFPCDDIETSCVLPAKGKVMASELPEVFEPQSLGPCQAVPTPNASALLEETSRDCSQDMVPCNVFTIVPIGESKAGKTSLMRTIMTKKSCLMEEGDSTIVADPLRWIPSDHPETVFLINDVGGQDTYKSTTPCFQVNSPSCLNILCHDITSTKYVSTFYWLKATQTNALDSKTVVILTKVDQLMPRTVTEKAAKFIRRFSTLIDYEIERLEELTGECDLESSSWNIHTKNIQNYRIVKEQMHRKLPLVSCMSGWEDSVGEVRTLLTRFANDQENRVVLRSVDRDLLLKIGELGIQPPMLEEQQGSQTEYMHQQFIAIAEVMHVFEPILQQHNIKPQNSVKEVKEILTGLSKKGLLGYFAGDEILEEIIFNIPTLAHILQCIYHHDIETYLQFQKLDRSLRTKLFDDNKVKFVGDMDYLRQHGILSMPILTLLLEKNKCLVEGKVVMQLLSHFDVGIPFDSDTQDVKKIFVPFFITRVFAPKDVAQMKQDILNCEVNVLSLHTVVKGNLPPAYFHQLLVKLQKNLKECHAFHRENLTWSKGLRARLGQSNARLMMLHNNDNEIEFIIQADISKATGHCLMWDYINIIEFQSKEIKTSRFPGLPFSYVLTCTCCRIRKHKSPDIWLVEKLLESASMETFTCRNLHAVHAAMLRPLSEEETQGRDFLDSLHKYLEGIVEELSPKNPNVDDGRGTQDTNKEYQAGHQGFLKKLKKRFSLFSRRDKESTAVKQDEGYSIKQQAEKDVPFPNDGYVWQGIDIPNREPEKYRTKPDEMYDYLTPISYSKYAAPQSSRYLMYDLEDASVLDLRHPTLKKYRKRLQIQMKPTEELLTLLVHSGLITDDEKTAILSEASNVGMINRILWNVDQYGVGGVEMLAEALRRCRDHENRKLSDTLERRLDSAYDVISRKKYK